MVPVAEEQYRDFIIKIYQDEGLESPRNCDNLGTMLCKHRSYDLGDAKASEDMTHEEIKEFVARENVISLPLYLLDHGGLWMRTGRFGSDPGGWDTSMVGWITVTLEKTRKEFNVRSLGKRLREKVIFALVSEVEVYSQYLEGEVYGYEIYLTREDEHSSDSCWGLYGLDYALAQARESADSYYERKVFVGQNI